MCSTAAQNIQATVYDNGGRCTAYCKNNDKWNNAWFQTVRQMQASLFQSWMILQWPWDTLQPAIYMKTLGCVLMQKTEMLNTIIFVSRLELADSAKAVMFSPGVLFVGFL